MCRDLAQEVLHTHEKEKITERGVRLGWFALVTCWSQGQAVLLMPSEATVDLCLQMLIFVVDV